MIRLSLVVALALAGTAGTAQASVMTVGGGFAESCYLAADSRNKTWQALDDCNRALQDEPLTLDERVATYVNRGILYLQRAAAAKAGADFDKALSMDPTQPEAWLNKAILTVKFGRSADARPMVEKALELKTRRPALAYYVRGMVNEDSGNLRAAYNDYKRARDLEPKWNEPAIELARFQVR